MTNLQKSALASLPLTAATIESFWDGSRSGTAEQCLRALCISHERLRAELQGAEVLLAEEPGKAAVRSLLTACKEAVAILRSLNDYERVCRELIAAKVEGGDDLAVVLSNVLRRLDNAAEAVERSLSPVRAEGSDFQEWMRETFYGRDTDLKMESVPYAHVFDYDQTIQLATFLWECMENKLPPWWSRFYGAEARLSKAAALTDTGSAEFRQAFPPKSAGEALAPREMVPGWRVVEKIRETLIG